MHQSTPINFFNYGLWLRIWDSLLPCSNVNKANWTWSFLPLHDLPSVMLIAFSAPYLDLNLKMQSIYSIQSSSLWVWWKPIHDLHSWAWPPILLSCFLHVGCEKETWVFPQIPQILCQLLPTVILISFCPFSFHHASSFDPNQSEIFLSTIAKIYCTKEQHTEYYYYHIKNWYNTNIPVKRLKKKCGGGGAGAEKKPNIARKVPF